jgi:uncharacterized protein (DUF1697 family)
MKYISILRGINVSGHKKILMADFRAHCSSLGLGAVQTYIQSGNVVYDATLPIGVSAEDHCGVLSTKLSESIAENWGFEVPVITLLSDELKMAVAENPFLLESDCDLTKLHITFLSALPDESRVDALAALPFLPDRFIIHKKQVYIYCPNGYGETKISNNFFESKLKVGATTRNWKTILELCNMSDS